MRRTIAAVGAAIALLWLMQAGAQPAEELGGSTSRVQAREERIRLHREEIRKRLDEAKTRYNPAEQDSARKDKSGRLEEESDEPGAHESDEIARQETDRSKGMVRTVLSEAPIERVLATIEQQTGVEVRPRGEVRGTRISLLVRDATLTSALDMIVSSKEGWMLVEPAERPGTYEIWDRNTYEREIVLPKLPYRVFELHHIQADEARRVVSVFLSRNLGQVISAPSSGRIIVRDRADVLDTIADLLKQVDRPPVAGPTQVPAPPPPESTSAPRVMTTPHQTPSTPSGF